MNSTETFVVDWPVTGESRSIIPQATLTISGHSMAQYRVRQFGNQEMRLAHGNAGLPGGARSEAGAVPGLLADSPIAKLARAMV
jgi:hypothetical protein